MRRYLALFLMMLCGCSTTVIQSGASPTSPPPSSSPSASPSASSSIPDFGVTLGTQLDFCDAAQRLVPLFGHAPYLAGDDRARSDLRASAAELHDLAGQFETSGDSLDALTIDRMALFFADFAGTIPKDIDDVAAGLRDQAALFKGSRLHDVQQDFNALISDLCR